MKKYILLASGRAEILNASTCPICGAAHSSNLDEWDYVSGVYNKMPLLCGHGFYITECTDSSDASTPWTQSVCIHKRYIQELEALGYLEDTERQFCVPEFEDDESSDSGLSTLADKTVICPICGAETKLFLYASTIDWCWQSQCLDCGETFKYNPQTGESTDDFPDLRN